MKHYVIFDLDGTLLDTLEDLRDSVNHALRAEGLPERSLDEVRAFVGNGIRRLIERAVPQGSSAETVDRVHAAFSAHYAEHCADKTAPYAGIPELLAELRSRCCKLGVVSNKDDAPARALIGRFFPDTFDSVVGTREGVRKKPAPDSLLETLSVLGGDVREAVYVGDSDVDALTAANAGCDCVPVSWGFRDRALLEALGRPVADSPEELLQLLSSD